MIAKIKKAVSYFTAAEIILWAVSVLLITSSFFIFARREYLTLAASLVGVTALIFCAKGNPAGQALMILFSAMYGVISFTFAYYGEMMTYLGMSAPMAVFSLVSWLRNPYEGKRSEVKVSALGAAETVCIFIRAVRRCDARILLHSRSARHRKSAAEYAFGHDELSCGLSHVQKKPVLCRGIRGK